MFFCLLLWDTKRKTHTIYFNIDNLLSSFSSVYFLLTASTTSFSSRAQIRLLFGFTILLGQDQTLRSPQPHLMHESQTLPQNALCCMKGLAWDSETKALPPVRQRVTDSRGLTCSIRPNNVRLVSPSRRSSVSPLPPPSGSGVSSDTCRTSTRSRIFEISTRPSTSRTRALSTRPRGTTSRSDWSSVRSVSSIRSMILISTSWVCFHSFLTPLWAQLVVSDDIVLTPFSRYTTFYVFILFYFILF